MYVYIYGVSVKKNEKQKFASYFIIMLPIKKKNYHILVLNPEISDTPISPLLVELFISR
jgi:hypothetical protein